MKKIILSILFIAVISPILANGQDKDEKMSKSTYGTGETYQTTEQRESEPTATIQTKAFEPRNFSCDAYAGYSGVNSSSKSGSSDLYHGWQLGADFSFGRTFVFNFGIELAQYYPEKSTCTNLNFPVRIGFQHGWNNGGTDRYFRLLTGPLFQAYNLGKDSCKFNCEWDVRAEYEIGRFQFYLATAWGMCNLGSSSYKINVNTPVSAGIAVAFF